MAQEEKIRDKLINFRCSESEKKEIDGFAENLEISVAQLIRISIKHYKEYIENKDELIRAELEKRFDGLNIENLNEMKNVIKDFNQRYEKLEQKIQEIREKNKIDPEIIEFIEPGFVRYKRKILNEFIKVFLEKFP